MLSDVWRWLIPAHGALGSLDEAFIVIVIGVFVVLLIGPSLLSILRKESNEANAEESTERAPRTDQPPTDHSTDTPDHFKLD